MLYPKTSHALPHNDIEIDGLLLEKKLCFSLYSIWSIFFFNSENMFSTRFVTFLIGGQMYFLYGISNFNNQYK